MSLLQLKSNRANHSHSKWLTHLILFWYLCDIYPRPQAILLIEQSSQTENSCIMSSDPFLGWRIIESYFHTVNRMFHHFHYECHGPIIIRDFQWQKQLICLTFSFNLRTSNIIYKHTLKYKTIATAHFLSALVSFLFFLFFIWSGFKFRFSLSHHVY